MSMRENQIPGLLMFFFSHSFAVVCAGSGLWCSVSSCLFCWENGFEWEVWESMERNLWRAWKGSLGTLEKRCVKGFP